MEHMPARPPSPSTFKARAASSLPPAMMALMRRSSWTGATMAAPREALRSLPSARSTGHGSTSLSWAAPELRRALGRLRCHAASRPSANLSSLKGPSPTGRAAIQSGKFLSYFLEQLGVGDDIFGFYGAGSGDNDEAAARRRPLPQRRLSGGERRVLRQAPSDSTAANAAAHGRCPASRSATLGSLCMCSSACVCACGRSAGRAPDAARRPR